MKTVSITDGDTGHVHEGLSKVVPGGTGYHPTPPPVLPPPERPRTSGPRLPDPVPREGRRGFTRTFHAPGR